jgi:hypothetical protein
MPGLGHTTNHRPILDTKAEKRFVRACVAGRRDQCALGVSGKIVQHALVRPDNTHARSHRFHSSLPESFK